MDSHNIGVIGVVAFGLSVVILSAMGSGSRAALMLDVWASENGYEILSRENRQLFRGPYFFATRGQEVYRIVARGRDGIERSGYARCGGFWLGTWSRHVDVRWDETPGTSSARDS